jgi:hypothetical protein
LDLISADIVPSAREELASSPSSSERKISCLGSLVPEKKKRGQLRISMNIINRLGQSAYLFQGNLLYLAGGSGLEYAVWRIGCAC